VAPVAQVGDEYRHLQPLLDRFAAMSGDHPSRRALRNELVTGYLPLAEHLCRRFVRRGVPLEDLIQVATVGLINSVDRYDPTHEHGFLPFAIPTIRGELRRYFRDHTWSMRVPRRIKELCLAIREVSPPLSAELGRAPRPSEIARRLRVPTEHVLDALQAAEAHTTASLDTGPVPGANSAENLGEMVGEADGRLEMVEYRQALGPLLEVMPDRERAILVMRFFGNMTQTQIAEKVGISQMHVSRLLQQTLARLREQLND